MPKLASSPAYASVGLAKSKPLDEAGLNKDPM